MLNNDHGARSGVTTTNQLPAHLICFSHLRWQFVYQRPQHLLSGLSKVLTVHYIEEPVFGENDPYFEIDKKQDRLWTLVPHIPEGLGPDEVNNLLETLLTDYIAALQNQSYGFWYYTPMALAWSADFAPVFTVYDCMDELSAFKFAPPELKMYEWQLFEKADIVFTGGFSLYEAKKDRHANIHPFPSSIDKTHFGKARNPGTDPSDQASIPFPRFGFAGVIDERFDIDLLSRVARLRPDWQFIIIGPVVKIDPATLPQRPNIHYLGPKNYLQLPEYMGGWDVGLVPFALNESTRFISPTKTPEYLSAGLPVISSPIKDVVDPYGMLGLVEIVADYAEFIEAGENILQFQRDKTAWLQRVDQFLSNQSWEDTVDNMLGKIKEVVNRTNAVNKEEAL